MVPKKIRGFLLLAITFLLIEASALYAKEKGYSFSQYRAKNSLKIEQKVKKEYSAILRSKKHSSKNIIKAIKFEKGAKKSASLKNFEVRFLDDQNDYYQDYSTGEVNIESSINSSQSIRSLKLIKRDYVTTFFDLVFEKNYLLNTVPVISEKRFRFLNKKYQVPLGQSGLLIELDEMTDDAEISLYKKKVFLNNQFQTVSSSESEFNYILFLGVPPGNTVINYKVGNIESYSKIVFVDEMSIFFDSNYFVNPKVKEIRFKVKNVLGSKRVTPQIDNKSIRFFSQSNTFKKINQNSIKLNNKKVPLGTRLYFEVGNKKKIYFGTWEKEEVEVPSEEFISYAMEKMNSNNDNCILQFNVTKSPKKMTMNGRKKNGPLYIESFSLDSDGEIYKDVGSETKKIFIKGEGTGAVNVKLDYTDGTTDYLQSYCTVGSYLVEQI